MFRCSPNKKIYYDLYIMDYFFKHGFNRLAVTWERRIYYKYSCHFVKGVNINYSVKFPHLLGITIGPNVKLGSNILIFQNVTIGSSRGDKFAMPIIENDVTIYSGAVIGGAITIGEGSIIGANAVVTRDIPANSMVTGNNQIKTLESGY